MSSRRRGVGRFLGTWNGYARVLVDTQSQMRWGTYSEARLIPELPSSLVGSEGRVGAEGPVSQGPTE